MSIIGMLTGENANRRLNNTRGEINAGTAAAQGQFTAGENTAQGYLARHLNRGGQDYYDATLGINPRMSANDANKAYFSNNADQEQLALQQKQRGWASNSRGGYATPMDSLAAARINAQNYGNWQNRLAGVAQDEGNMARTAAGVSQWGAAGRAGVQQAGTNALGQIGMAQAQNENTFMQNLIGLGSVAASAYTGMPMRRPGGGQSGGGLGGATGGGFAGGYGNYIGGSGGAP